MFRFWFVFGLCLGLSGCGDPSERLYPVTGKIVFADGTCAQFGNIECRSFSKPPTISRSNIGKDGSFDLSTVGKRGVIAGEHQMLIVQVISRAKRNIVHDHGHEVATKYRQYESSGLKIDVKPDGKNHFELTVESK